METKYRIKLEVIEEGKVSAAYSESSETDLKFHRDSETVVAELFANALVAISGTGGTPSCEETVYAFLKVLGLVCDIPHLRAIAIAYQDSDGVVDVDDWLKVEIDRSKLRSE